MQKRASVFYSIEATASNLSTCLRYYKKIYLTEFALYFRLIIGNNRKSYYFDVL